MSETKEKKNRFQLPSINHDSSSVERTFCAVDNDEQFVIKEYDQQTQKMTITYQVPVYDDHWWCSLTVATNSTITNPLFKVSRHPLAEAKATKRVVALIVGTFETNTDADKFIHRWSLLQQPHTRIVQAYILQGLSLGMSNKLIVASNPPLLEKIFAS